MRKALVKLKDKKTVGLLIKKLNDKDPLVRWTAALVLGNLGDKSCVPALIKVLDDPDVDVRMHAVRALGDLRDKRAVEPLIGRLDVDGPIVVRWVAEALINISTDYDKNVAKALLKAAFKRPEWEYPKPMMEYFKDYQKKRPEIQSMMEKSADKERLAFVPEKLTPEKKKWFA